MKPMVCLLLLALAACQMQQKQDKTFTAENLPKDTTECEIRQPLSASELAQRLEKSFATEVTPNYVGEKNYPDYYGGIFLDQNQFLIVLVKGNGEFYRPELERRAGGSNFIIRPCDYSMNELLEVYDELNRYLTAHQAFCTDTLHYYGHGIRTDLNRISVHLGDCSPASISKFKATVMDDDRLIFEKGEIAVFD